MIPYEQLSQSFQARHIEVPLDLAFSVDPGDSVRSAARELRARSFDQAPVQDHGRLLGFVLTRQLEAADRRQRVASVVIEIGPGNIVSADAPVGRLFEWIVDPGLLFVLAGRLVTGFVTISDFNKQAARSYLYLLIATLESTLADLVRDELAAEQDNALVLLPSKARARIKERIDLDRELNVEGDVLSYLDFSHLLNVIAKRVDLRRALGFESQATWDDATGGLVPLRNSVMHPVRSLVSSKSGLIQLEERHRRLHDLIGVSSGVLSERRPTTTNGA